MMTIERASRIVRRTVVLTAAAAALAQPVNPALDKPYDGATSVSGTAAPGSGPVTIYDLFYPVKTRIGSTAALDRNGKFSVVVKPALVKGHPIGAVDGAGHASSPVVVEVNPDTAASPAK